MINVWHLAVFFLAAFFGGVTFTGEWAHWTQGLERRNEKLLAVSILGIVLVGVPVFAALWHDGFLSPPYPDLLTGISGPLQALGFGTAIWILSACCFLLGAELSPFGRTILVVIRETKVSGVTERRVRMRPGDQVRIWP